MDHQQPVEKPAVSIFPKVALKVLRQDIQH